MQVRDDVLKNTSSKSSLESLSRLFKIALLEQDLKSSFPLLFLDLVELHLKQSPVGISIFSIEDDIRKLLALPMSEDRRVLIVCARLSNLTSLYSQDLNQEIVQKLLNMLFKVLAEPEIFPRRKILNTLMLFKEYINQKQMKELVIALQEICHYAGFEDAVTAMITLQPYFDKEQAVQICGFMKTKINEADSLPRLLGYLEVLLAFPDGMDAQEAGEFADFILSMDCLRQANDRLFIRSSIVLFYLTELGADISNIDLLEFYLKRRMQGTLYQGSRISILNLMQMMSLDVTGEMDFLGSKIEVECKSEFVRAYTKAINLNEAAPLLSADKLQVILDEIYDSAFLRDVPDRSMWGMFPLLKKHYGARNIDILNYLLDDFAENCLSRKFIELSRFIPFADYFTSDMKIKFSAMLKKMVEKNSGFDLRVFDRIITRIPIKYSSSDAYFYIKGLLSRLRSGQQPLEQSLYLVSNISRLAYFLALPQQNKLLQCMQEWQGEVVQQGDVKLADILAVLVFGLESNYRNELACNGMTLFSRVNLPQEISEDIVSKLDARFGL